MLYRLSAQDLHKAFLKGEHTASEIAAYFLARVQHLDEDIGAFLTVLSDRVMEKAAELDKKRGQNKPLGKLAGVPIAIKDNIHINGEMTTCASRFLSNYRAPFSATVVDLIEKEDGLILGKTNLDEFAMGSSTEHSALQTTRNPWNLSKTAGGSSGGSAAAVGARCAPLALGSDTGGSIRLPASFTGTVGLKPSYGRVSRFGLVEFGSSLDQIGPFAHSVADAALMLEVIGKPCSRDATTLPTPGKPYLDALTSSIQGKVIGIPWSALKSLSSSMHKHFEMTIALFKELGAQVIDTPLALIEASIPVYYVLSTAEASTNLSRFDGVRYGKRSEEAASLDEIYDFSRREGFGHEVKQRIMLGTFVLSSGYQEAYYQQAQKVRTLIIQEYARAFKECDVIAMPTTIAPPFDLGSISSPVEMYQQDLYTIGANLAGLPAISVPTGLDGEGLPLSIQLLGPHFADDKVLRFAAQLEQALCTDSLIPPLCDKEVAS